MKKIITLSVCFLFLSFWGSAQISLSYANMPTPGWSEEFAKDSPVTTINYGSAGANQVYDFSALHLTSNYAAVYSSPTTAQQTHYPSANLMVTADSINYFAVLSNTSGYTTYGLQTSLDGNIVYTQFSPADKLFEFPTQYQGNFTGSWGFIEAVPAAWVNETQGGLVDSVKITYTDTYYDTIDGWGTVKTPLGSYNGLREARKDVTHTNIQAYYFGSWNNVSDWYSDAVTYQYLAKETKGAVVKFDYDTGVDAAILKDAQYSLIPPSPIAYFTFVTGADGLVTFTDGSSNSPASYSWNFGDGSALGTTKNPTHTYTTNGTYYVCETVTNASGDSTYCDSVHITNIPAPTAHFTWTAAGGGLIDFTNQNTGNPTTYHWTFGDGDTSNVANPTHTYAANGAYYVCETVSNANGSNTYCDSVHVTGIAAGHVAPVAVGDTASVIKPNSVTVNVTANDYSPSGDVFCITGVSNTTYFTVQGCNDIVFNSTNAPAPGIDSTWYVICNTNQPTLCDSALLIVNVEKAHVAPVAVTVYDTTLQPNPTTFSLTANDSSPSGDAFCIRNVYPPAGFTIVNCNNVTYTPDSTFTGNDTAYYVICNTGQPTLCDTAEVIVTVEPHSIPCQLTDSITNLCGGGLQGGQYSCAWTASSTVYFSSLVDSLKWTVVSVGGSPF